MPQCVSCIVEDIREALDLLGARRKDVDEVLTGVLKYLGGHYGKNEPASYYITETHRMVKRHFNLAMPFSSLRETCLASCAEIARAVGREAAGYDVDGKFRFLLRWTIAGNALDFRTAGAGYDIAAAAIERMLRDNFTAGLCVDEVDRIHSMVKSARRIVFVPDNVGELPFDKMFLAQCKSYGASIVVPFRGGPITSDVVIEDATAVRMDEAADRIIVSGPDTLGISLAEMTEECRAELDGADLIIAKGQANFYVLSEFGTQFPNAAIISLLVTKCPCVSGVFGKSGKVNIAVVVKEAGGPVRFGKEKP
jgi:uncharacterized protein with ATP-grasp and redox domains